MFPHLENSMNRLNFAIKINFVEDVGYMIENQCHALFRSRANSLIPASLDLMGSL